MAEQPNVPPEAPGERRQVTRFPYHTKASCHSVPILTGTSCLATAQDISLAGIGLLCEREFEAGTWLFVELWDAHTHCTTLPICRVVFTRKKGPGSWLVGCAFRERMSEENLKALLAEVANGKSASVPTKPASSYRSHEHLEGMAQALFEESGDALFIIDPDSGQLLDANSMAQRLSGWPLRELLRLEVTYLLRSEAEKRLEDLVHAFRKTRVFHSQTGYYLRTTQEGIWVPVNLTVSRLHVKPKTLGLLTARDMRGQNDDQGQPKKPDSGIRRLLTTVSDCIWAARVDGAGQWVYHYISAGVEKITGQPPEHFLAGVHRWWDMVHPEDRSRWEKALVRLKSGQGGQEEYRIVCADDTVRRVRDNVMVARGADGKSLWLTGVVIDLTEPK